jgi:excinuclease UvrABC helicase subunit UvrB
MKDLTRLGKQVRELAKKAKLAAKNRNVEMANDIRCRIAELRAKIG